MRPFACDMVLIEDGKILLIRRAAEPYKGMWAVPGGRIEDDESAEQCLKREMEEETGLEVEPIRLTGLYSDPRRDPRGVIAAAYLVRRTGGELKAGDDAAEANWFPLYGLPELAADHKKIIEDALRGP
ncbi:MAG: NUDIX hydrolase [Candidatus Micrarchaeota archaeon]